MGCWNKTCALSNLPIYVGDRTYVFVLNESSNYEKKSAVYTSYLYSPLLLPFESDYNDYGGGENSAGYAFPLVMKALKKELIEKEIGENEYHDIAVKKEDFGEELFFEAIHEDRLEISDYDGIKKVKFVMMRKEIVDNILDEWVIEDYKGYDEEAHKSIYFRYKFEDVLGDVDPFLERCSKIHASLSDENEAISALKSLYSVDLKGWLGDWKDSLVAKWLMLGDRGTYYQSPILNVGILLAEHLHNGEFKEAKIIIELYLKGLFVNSFMDQTRRCWVPPCGEGSQGSDLEPYELLCKVVSNSLAEERKEREGEDEY